MFLTLSRLICVCRICAAAGVFDVPCFSPLRAFQTSSGDIVFSELVKHGDIRRSLDLPCGQCIGCRLERSRQWAVRITHEASLHSANCFITLTYDDAHLPERLSLVYLDFQQFFKRLRKHQAPLKIRFFAVGEYGDLNKRPHWHACIFGEDFRRGSKSFDRQFLRRSPAGSDLYRSSVLEGLWPFGHSSIGELNFESAAYCARYCLGKVTGHNAADHYRRVDPSTGEVYSLTPELARMSLKPGIGAGWFRQFSSDVFPHDRVVSRGKAAKPPRYYDKLLDKADSLAFDDIRTSREFNASLLPADNSNERLSVRSVVAAARVNLFKRSV